MYLLVAEVCILRLVLALNAFFSSSKGVEKFEECV